MSSVVKFGTDGWRGVIAEDYTFDNVRICAQGVAQYLVESGKSGPGMVVGHDTRFASEHFAVAAAEVMAGNGIKTLLVNRATPTPVISYAILANKTAGAINITASHNPPTDNGFKIRSEYGGAAAPETLTEIEKRINQMPTVKRMARAEAMSKGMITVFDPAPAYLTHLKDMIDVEPIRQSSFNVVVDSMWGAGIGWLKGILDGGKITVAEIHGTRNPSFPGMFRPEPITANLRGLSASVRRRKADVGLATDGDADRVGFVDENGNFVNQLLTYALLAYYLLEVRKQRGAIVKALSTTSMLEKLGKLYNVPVYETGVGFKYVAPKMLETNAMVGGEESGGYAFHGHMPERDGILASLFLLDLMRHTGKTPSQLVQVLFSMVGPHYYDRLDTSFPLAQRTEISQRMLANPPAVVDGSKVVRVQTDDGFKYHLADGSWLLIRFSGTEPIMRIYTETNAPERVQRIIQEGRKIVGVQAGARQAAMSALSSRGQTSRRSSSLDVRCPVNVPYNYCPRCAGPMVQQQTQGRIRPVCPACGCIIYHNPKVAVGVIPVLDGKIAMVRRAMQPQRGTWVFPGGYVDVGENVEDAARREVWEETGLTVRLEQLIGAYSRRGDEVVLLVFSGQVIDGALCAGDEELEAGWFSPDALPPEEALGFWSTVQAIKDWQAREVK